MTATELMTRILIADDHAMLRKGLRTVLEPRTDWDIVGEATTGLEALEMTKSIEPDLVVLDVSMPILNGLEVAHRISLQPAECEDPDVHDAQFSAVCSRRAEEWRARVRLQVQW